MSVLLDCAEERYAAMPREAVDWVPWMETEAPKRTGFLGSMARVFTTAGRRPHRYCDKLNASEWGGTILNMHELEVRGTYLRRCLGDAVKRRTWSHADEAAADEVGFSPPSFFRVPPDGVALAEVDLSSAYVQFYEHFSTRVEYRAGSGLWSAVGEPFLDTEELRRHRILYASIASHAWRAKHSPRWVQGEWVPQKVVSPLYNPQASRLLVDMLHAVAQEMVCLFAAVAVKTDSYVVPAHRADEAMAYLAGRWDLASKVKRTWHPGEPWPGSWAHNYRSERSNLRDQDALVRQRLAHGMTGEGRPIDAAPLLLNSGAIEMPEEHYEPEPEPQAWHRSVGVTPWQLIDCPLPPRSHRRHAEPKQRCGARRASLLQEMQGAEVLEVLVPRGPPTTS